MEVLRPEAQNLICPVDKSIQWQSQQHELFRTRRLRSSDQCTARREAHRCLLVGDPVAAPLTMKKSSQSSFDIRCGAIEPLVDTVVLELVDDVIERHEGVVDGVYLHIGIRRRGTKHESLNHVSPPEGF